MPSKRVVYRARALILPTEADAWQAVPDAGLEVEDGQIRHVGPITDFRQHPFSEEIELNGIILPGFLDVHIHWVQHAVRGAFQGELMEWLRSAIWPEEARYHDAALIRERAAAFARDMLGAGTVGGLAYSSPHIAALREGLRAVQGHWRMGNVLMTENAPEALLRAGVHDIDVLDAVAQAIGPDRFVLTPRFALNVNEAFMGAMGTLAHRLNLFVQTHLAESRAECQAVNRAFPRARDYTDVYDRAGLLGRKTLLGHCIHLSPREFACLRARGSWIAHCPSSNEALDSGRMDIEAVRKHRIPFALASDVGAGPSHSMLHVMQRFLAQHRGAGAHVTAQEALYRATTAGARFLGLARHTPLTPGTPADFVLLPAESGHFDAEGWLESVIHGTSAELENRVLGTWIDGEKRHGAPYAATA